MATIQRLWWVGLTGVLGLFYLAIGVTVGGATGIVAILGAVLVIAALALRTNSKRAAVALLMIGTLPLGIFTWWSLITPVVAMLALICGGLAIGTSSQRRTPRI